MTQPTDQSSREQEPCGSREYCGRFPFCGCGSPDPLPERDTSKPAEQQGLFRKFDVKRTDGSDGPGGKHEGCEYFVLDVNHDPHARAALAAYAKSVWSTHPALYADMRERYDLSPLIRSTSPTAITAEEAGREGEAKDAARYREVLKSGIPWSKDVCFTDEQIDAFVDKRIDERLAAMKLPSAPAQSEGQG